MISLESGQPMARDAQSFRRATGSWLDEDAALEARHDVIRIGLTMVPSATFDTCPRDLSVLFTPGGTDDTLAAASHPDTRA